MSHTATISVEDLHEANKENEDQTVAVTIGVGLKRRKSIMKKTRSKKSKNGIKKRRVSFGPNQMRTFRRPTFTPSPVNSESDPSAAFTPLVAINDNAATENGSDDEIDFVSDSDSDVEMEISDDESEEEEGEEQEEERVASPGIPPPPESPESPGIPPPPESPESPGITPPESPGSPGIPRPPESPESPGVPPPPDSPRIPGIPPSPNSPELQLPPPPDSPKSPNESVSPMISPHIPQPQPVEESSPGLPLPPPQPDSPRCPPPDDVTAELKEGFDDPDSFLDELNEDLDFSIQSQDSLRSTKFYSPDRSSSVSRNSHMSPSPSQPGLGLGEGYSNFSPSTYQPGALSDRSGFSPSITLAHKQRLGRTRNQSMPNFSPSTTCPSGRSLGGFSPSTTFAHKQGGGTPNQSMVDFTATFDARALQFGDSFSCSFDENDFAQKNGFASPTLTNANAQFSADESPGKSPEKSPSIARSPGDKEQQQTPPSASNQSPAAAVDTTTPSQQSSRGVGNENQYLTPQQRTRNIDGGSGSSIALFTSPNSDIEIDPEELSNILLSPPTTLSTPESPHNLDNIPEVTRSTYRFSPTATTMAAKGPGMRNYWTGKDANTAVTVTQSRHFNLPSSPSPSPNPKRSLEKSKETESTPPRPAKKQKQKQQRNSPKQTSSSVTVEQRKRRRTSPRLAAKRRAKIHADAQSEKEAQQGRQEKQQQEERQQQEEKQQQLEQQEQDDQQKQQENQQRQQEEGQEEQKKQHPEPEPEPEPEHQPPPQKQKHSQKQSDSETEPETEPDKSAPSEDNIMTEDAKQDIVPPSKDTVEVKEPQPQPPPSAPSVPSVVSVPNPPRVTLKEFCRAMNLPLLSKRPIVKHNFWEPVPPRVYNTVAQKLKLYMRNQIGEIYCQFNDEMEKHLTECENRIQMREKEINEKGWELFDEYLKVKNNPFELVKFQERELNFYKHWSQLPKNEWSRKYADLLQRVADKEEEIARKVQGDLKIVKARKLKLQERLKELRLEKERREKIAAKMAEVNRLKASNERKAEELKKLREKRAERERKEKEYQADQARIAKNKRNYKIITQIVGWEPIIMKDDELHIKILERFHLYFNQSKDNGDPNKTIIHLAWIYPPPDLENGLFIEGTPNGHDDVMALLFQDIDARKIWLSVYHEEDARSRLVNSVVERLARIIYLNKELHDLPFGYYLRTGKPDEFVEGTTLENAVAMIEMSLGPKQDRQNEVILRIGVDSGYPYDGISWEVSRKYPYANVKSLISEKYENIVRTEIYKPTRDLVTRVAERVCEAAFKYAGKIRDKKALGKRGWVIQADDTK